MKPFSVLLLVIGVALSLLGVGDIVEMYRRGNLAGDIGAIGIVVNGAILLVGVLFIGIALVMRRLADKKAEPAKE